MSKSRNPLFVFEGWRGVLKLAVIYVAVLVGFSATFIAIEVAPYRIVDSHNRARIKDLGELEHFRAANATLAPDPQRVVFIGDSITMLWQIGTAFHNPHFLNRGIGGQTSADILVRFRQDVIDLKPKTVIILDGINDFKEASQNGRISGEQALFNLEANDRTMSELAELHHIQPVFISVLPVHAYTPDAKKIYQRVHPELVPKANDWLKTYCVEHGYQFIDVFPAMVDPHGMLKKEFSDDGIHPNDAGYLVMSQAFSSQFRSD